MIFESHAFNIQRGEIEIKYFDIAEIRKRNTLFIILNRIKIIIKDEFNHKFVLNERNKIIEFLNNKIE